MKSIHATFRKAACVLMFGCLLGVSPARAQNDDLANGVDLKRNPKFPPPALLYSDLLNALQSQVTWSTGVLQVDGTIRALFLPDYSDPHSIYAYNPDTGAKLAHQLKTPGGAVVETQFYSGEKQKPPFWVLHPLRPPEQPLDAGDYVMEWFVEGDLFYRFPFTVDVEGGDDPYNPGGRYYFDGPWDDYAYLYIPDNNPASSPTFSVWFRDKSSTLSVMKSFDVNVTIRRGGQAVAYWPGPGEANPVDFPPYWERLDVGLRSGSSGFSAAELMKDGTYTVVVTVDGKPYAQYRYTARGGQVAHQDRQVRDATDPLDYIEGDTQRYFMKRVR